MTRTQLYTTALLAISTAFFGATAVQAQEVDIETPPALNLRMLSGQNTAPASVYKLTRAQVQAEAIEARRLGLLDHGDLTPREATPAELESIRLAGLRAIQGATATARR